MQSWGLHLSSEGNSLKQNNLGNPGGTQTLGSRVSGDCRADDEITVTHPHFTAQAGFDHKGDEAQQAPGGQGERGLGLKEPSDY